MHTLPFWTALETVLLQQAWKAMEYIVKREQIKIWWEVEN